MTAAWLLAGASFGMVLAAIIQLLVPNGKGDNP